MAGRLRFLLGYLRAGGLRQFLFKLRLHLREHGPRGMLGKLSGHTAFSPSFPDWERTPPQAPLAADTGQDRALFTMVVLDDRADAAAREAGTPFLLLLEPETSVLPGAHAELARAAAAFPDAALLYADEDFLGPDGVARWPRFKPAWSPETLLGRQYVGRACAVAREAFLAAGGLRSGSGEAGLHDLLLRLAETGPRVVHVPRILFRSPLGSAGFPAPDAGSPRVLREAMARRGLDARIHTDDVGACRRLEIRPAKRPRVSIIIPTRDRAALLERTVRSVLERSTHPDVEVLVVDNGSREGAARRLLADLSREPRVRVLAWDRPFNFSAINNFAVGQATGGQLLFLNNDMEVVMPDWIEQLAGWLEIPGVAAAGALLRYPGGAVQHAGVITGIGEAAGHAHKHFPRDAAGYDGRLLHAQNMTALTAACLLCRRDAFLLVGGFNERLAVAGNDVDLCLRLRRAGLRLVWTPHAELVHHESASRGREDDDAKLARLRAEEALLRETWGAGVLRADPCYSPHLTLLRENFAFREPPPAEPAPDLRPRAP